MFNTFALTLRPDEIRLFMVVFGAVVSATLVSAARWLRTMLERALERGRRGVLSPLDRLLAGPILVSQAALTSMKAATLECVWVVDGAGRLVCHWTCRSPLSPPRQSGSRRAGPAFPWRWRREDEGNSRS